MSLYDQINNLSKFDNMKLYIVFFPNMIIQLCMANVFTYDQMELCMVNLFIHDHFKHLRVNILICSYEALFGQFIHVVYGHLKLKMVTILKYNHIIYKTLYGQ